MKWASRSWPWSVVTLTAKVKKKILTSMLSAVCMTAQRLRSVGETDRGEKMSSWRGTGSVGQQNLSLFHFWFKSLQHFYLFMFKYTSVFVCVRVVVRGEKAQQRLPCSMFCPGGRSHCSLDARVWKPGQVRPFILGVCTVVLSMHVLLHVFFR